MKNNFNSRSSGCAGLLVGSALLLLTLPACNRDQPAVASAPAPQVAPATAPQTMTSPTTVVAVPDDYVYYPDYEVYYSNTRRMYYYANGGVWGWQPAPPPIVSVNILRAAPSVHMDFHDSPELHHAEVISRYPRRAPVPERGREGRGPGY